MVQTETATVVFTDLVGSTELASRLGHDAYEAMRRTHFSTLRLAASQCQELEIKSTGDGMVFSFGSASDALACMIRMQQTAISPHAAMAGTRGSGSARRAARSIATITTSSEYPSSRPPNCALPRRRDRSCGHGSRQGVGPQSWVPVRSCERVQP